MALGDQIGQRQRPAILLAGRYRLVEQIGRGGMGRVYHAHDDVLDRQVAVKLLDEPSTGRADPGQVGLAEASAAAHLAHPGIARIFDTGVDAGTAFIVMELVSGRTLRELLDERKALPVANAVALAAGLADALDYAHRHNVVHCDVKPHNVVVGPDGAPKLIDFGIARAVSSTNSASSSEIKGSAPYMAPEQAEGKPIDGRTDVYALGAVLFEMLTGRPPFDGPNVVAIISQRLVCDPPSPRSLDPSIGPGLERVVFTALAREPSARYSTAAAFRDALRESVGSSAQGTTGGVRLGPALSASGLGGRTTAPNAHTGVIAGLHGARSRPGVLLAVLALAGVLGAGAIAARLQVASETQAPTLPTLQPPTPEPPTPQPSNPQPPTQEPPTSPPPTPPIREDTSIPPPPAVQPAVAPHQPLAKPTPPKASKTRPSNDDRRREPDRRRERDDDDDD